MWHRKPQASKMHRNISGPHPNTGCVDWRADGQSWGRTLLCCKLPRAATKEVSNKNRTWILRHQDSVDPLFLSNFPPKSSQPIGCRVPWQPGIDRWNIWAVCATEREVSLSVGLHKYHQPDLGRKVSMLRGSRKPNSCSDKEFPCRSPPWQENIKALRRRCSAGTSGQDHTSSWWMGFFVACS